MIKSICKFTTLEYLCKQRKSKTYYGNLHKYKYCFTGNIQRDVDNANKILKTTLSNNTAHGYCGFFKGTYDLFYGKKFNPKYLLRRPGGVSKLTTRLTVLDIKYIRVKFLQGINEPLSVVDNKVKVIRESRKRIYHCFEALLCSGMRLGELVSIPFDVFPAHRVIYDNFSKTSLVEIIINTEKTCKKREIYIPEDSYNFLCTKTRMYKKKKLWLTRQLIIQGFINFKKGAKLSFPFTAHVLRRTKASLMHECNVDEATIAMVLGNTVRTVQTHYVISSSRNFDASVIANAYALGSIAKHGNIFYNERYLHTNSFRTTNTIKQMIN